MISNQNKPIESQASLSDIHSGLTDIIAHLDKVELRGYQNMTHLAFSIQGLNNLAEALNNLIKEGGIH